MPFEEQLDALGRAVAAGKVRHIGLSNETPWGLMACLRAAGAGAAAAGESAAPPGANAAAGADTTPPPPPQQQQQQQQQPRRPRVAAVQNAYSLLCRTFDAGLAEACHLEGVGLLAYSPLAMGLLTVRGVFSLFERDA